MIPCATCGAAPTGAFNDGSPSYRCGPHSPIKPEQAHPAYRAAILTARPLHGTLDPADQKLAAQVARRVGKKYEEARTATMKFRPKGYSIEDVNREGFAAELFVARWTGQEWHRGLRRKPDVGADIEVRSSRHPSAYMPIYTFDKPRRRFVLVTGASPHFRIVGWLSGTEGMAEQFWRPKGSMLRGVELKFACFAIPQGALHPMTEFETGDHDAVPEAPEATEAQA